jgi:primosomal replication protein N
LEVPRKSGVLDRIRVTAPERLLGGVAEGTYVSIDGQLHTFNEFDENAGRSRVIVYALAKNLAVLTEEEYSQTPVYNRLIIKGTICRQPSYRVTPAGRKISDFILAVDRTFERTDFLPVIAWAGYAKFCSELAVSTDVYIEGRAQSRDYMKIRDGQEQTLTAYEVSVDKITSLGRRGSRERATGDDNADPEA